VAGEEENSIKNLNTASRGGVVGAGGKVFLVSSCWLDGLRQATGKNSLEEIQFRLHIPTDMTDDEVRFGKAKEEWRTENFISIKK
jgi:hypothetical protein